MRGDRPKEPPVPPVSPAVPDHVPLAWRGALALLTRLPQAALSRGFGRVADAPIPAPLRRPLLGAFARAVGIDLAEAELPLEAYPTLDAFFVRRLTPGLRPFPGDGGTAGSPVDGIVGQLGEVRGGRAIQAKGRDYAVADLLDDEAAARRYEGGRFVTLYLSPRHYHRIHTPQAGTIPAARHIPGALLPVNAPAVARVPELFPSNERLVCYVDAPLGRVAVVAVGAFNVGRISAAFDPAWGAGPGATVTNRRGASPETRHYTPPVSVGVGAEIMAFHLGSTVVCLFEAGAARLEAALAPGAAVRLGQPIARVASR
ncbi:MAG TPA: archaetidylserine decarboxylase [Longimicrobiales bacterium]|nr:archaetidylserine decarboxylase [Longimicrobiales bacterium]